jgi:AAA domain-containing protein
MEALLIGGRSGSGKSVVGWEVAAQLRADGVAHAILEGDFMGQVHPPPADPAALVERNLAAVWANFAALGHRRLIYTNTLSVMPEATAMFERALGADVRLIRVLLTASDATARERLTERERGSELEDGLKASLARSLVLEDGVDAGTARIATDGRSVIEVAREIVALTGWCG